jgi:hypothetical protein
MSAEVVVMSEDKVKVAIQVRAEEGELGPREWLWATVVQEDMRKGIYCLLNGDRLVTALHRRGGRTAHMLVFPADADRAAIQRLAEEWGRATGTWVEGFGGGTVPTVAVERQAGGQPA